MSNVSDKVTETPTGPSMAADGSPSGVPERTEAVHSRALDGLGVIGLLLPVVAYFWFIHRYGANVLWHDQFADIDTLSHLYSHTLSIGTLWTQHDENRVLFPNLVVLLLGVTTHLNVSVEEYLSGFLLAAAILVLIQAHRKRSIRTHWAAYTPVALIMFSFVQFTNTLWGFQLAWYVVLLALAVALFLLDCQVLTPWILTGAIAAAVVASFSSLQGLLIWPVGLVLLHSRKRDGSFWIAWIASALVATVVYFYHFQLNSSVSNNSLSFAFAHPRQAAEFFFTAIGNMVGVQTPYSPTAHNYAVMAFGVMVVGIAVWVIISFGLHRDATSGSPLGVALVCFGLLFALTITEGRTLAGWGLSAGIRYATFDLLILVGCYLAILAPPQVPGRARRRDRYSLNAARLVLAVVVGLQVVLGVVNGLSGARSWHQDQLLAANLTANINKIPGSVVSSAFIPGFPSDMAYTRRMVSIASAHHLSLFGTGAVAIDRRRGLPARFRPSTRVTSPSKGSILTGTATLAAGASAPLESVTSVEFWISGAGRVPGPIGTARYSGVNWSALWDTTTVANGTYVLQSVVYYSGGNTRSEGVAVVVHN